MAAPVPAEALPVDDGFLRKEEDKNSAPAYANNDQVVVSAAADLNDSDEPTPDEYKTLRKWVPFHVLVSEH